MNLLREITCLLFDAEDGRYAHLDYAFARQSVLSVTAGVTVMNRRIEIATRRDDPNVVFKGPSWQLDLTWDHETRERPVARTFQGHPGECENDLFFLRMFL